MSSGRGGKARSGQTGAPGTTSDAPGSSTSAGAGAHIEQVRDEDALNEAFIKAEFARYDAGIENIRKLQETQQQAVSALAEGLKKLEAALADQSVLLRSLADRSDGIKKTQDERLAAVKEEMVVVKEEAVVAARAVAGAISTRLTPLLDAAPVINETLEELKAAHTGTHSALKGLQDRMNVLESTVSTNAIDVTRLSETMSALSTGDAGAGAASASASARRVIFWNIQTERLTVVDKNPETLTDETEKASCKLPKDVTLDVAANKTLHPKAVVDLIVAVHTHAEGRRGVTGTALIPYNLPHVITSAAQQVLTNGPRASASVKGLAYIPPSTASAWYDTLLGFIDTHGGDLVRLLDDLTPYQNEAGDLVTEVDVYKATAAVFSVFVGVERLYLRSNMISRSDNAKTRELCVRAVLKALPNILSCKIRSALEMGSDMSTVPHSLTMTDFQKLAMTCTAELFASADTSSDARIKFNVPAPTTLKMKKDQKGAGSSTPAAVQQKFHCTKHGNNATHDTAHCRMLTAAAGAGAVAPPSAAAASAPAGAPAPSTARKTGDKVCSFYNGTAGSCNKGDKCTFKHAAK